MSGEVGNRAKFFICQELILFSMGWSEQEYYFFPLDGKITYRRFPFPPSASISWGFPDNLLISIYPHGWREVPGKSVVPKNTITRPGSSMLTVGHLPQGGERKLTNQPVCVNRRSTEFINPYHFAIRELNVLNELSCNRIPETFRSLCLSNKHASNLWNNKTNM